MRQDAPIAIIGAGIAGLTAALCLARKGIGSYIVEQAIDLAEVGAGLQLSPNATRILTSLGLLTRLEQVWSEPGSIDLVSGTSLRTLASVPCGPFARTRWTAPYGVLRRADLQKVLLDAVMAAPLCHLHLGTKIETASTAFLERIIGARPALAIGADGVWSKVRNDVQHSGKATFSGYIAWRFTHGEADVPAMFDPTKVMAFLGPGSHLVVYPMPSSRSFNVVAITSGRDPGETWNSTPSSNDGRTRLLSAFGHWNPELRTVLRNAENPTIWPLYAVSDGAWNRINDGHDGCDTVLIGDAAHAMLPFAAQGAAMAIEDAFELASFIASGKPIAAFVAHRKARVERVRARGAFNRFAYHARGPIRLGRDLVLSFRKPERLAADFDWLYGYEPLD